MVMEEQFCGAFLGGLWEYTLLENDFVSKSS